MKETAAALRMSRKVDVGYKTHQLVLRQQPPWRACSKSEQNTKQALYKGIVTKNQHRGEFTVIKWEKSMDRTSSGK